MHLVADLAPMGVVVGGGGGGGGRALSSMFFARQVLKEFIV